MRRDESVVVDDIGIINVVVGLKRLEDLHDVAIEEMIVFRPVAGRTVAIDKIVVSPEKRLPVEQAVVDRSFQDELRDPGAQQGVLAAQVLIVCLPPRVGTHANHQRQRDREGQHARNQVQCQSSLHGSILGNEYCVAWHLACAGNSRSPRRAAIDKE